MKSSIFDLYRELQVGVCDICKDCNALNGNQLTQPISFWTIGEKFELSEDKILFVGKTAVGGDDWPLIDNQFHDATTFGTNALAGGYSSSYYSYTNEIISQYFGSFDEGKKNVAFTNLIKCNNGTTQDSTIWETKINCLDKLKVVWNEVEILRPQRIVFYTNIYYDDFIARFLPSFANNFIDVHERSNWIKVGQKYSYWWHRDFYDDKGLKTLSFLRLSHPERLLKADYVENVVKWLKQTKM